MLKIVAALKFSVLLGVVHFFHTNENGTVSAGHAKDETVVYTDKLSKDSDYSHNQHHYSLCELSMMIFLIDMDHVPSDVLHGEEFH